MIGLRRWAILLLSVLMCFGTMISSAFASSGPITVTASYHENTGQVTITGTVNSGQGKLVTVQVTNPLNQLDYLDQTTAGENGSYQFNYVLKKRINGTYFVNIAGQDAGQATGTTFEVKMTANTSFDGHRTLTVTGNLGISAGNGFTVQIVNPLGTEEFKQDGVTGENGVYTVSYTIPRLILGNYVITVKGLRADAVATMMWNNTLADGRKNSSGGSGGTSHGAPGTTIPGTDTPIPLPKPNEAGLEVRITPDITVDPTGRIVSAKLDAEELSAVISAGGTHVIVEIQSKPGAEQYRLDAPANLFAPSSPNKITVATEFASVSMPVTLSANVNLEGAKQVGLVISKADLSKLPDDLRKLTENKPAIELSMAIDGAAVSMNHLAKVAIPYEPTEQELNDPEHIVVWSVDPTGKVEPVPNGKYDAASGTVTFTASHFNTFAVAFVKKSFTDLDTVEWAKKPIEVMASKGIISGISDMSFNPGAAITRADFMMLLTKTFGFTAEVPSNFSDVHPNSYYYEAVGIAKQLGLAEGQGDGRFNPNEQISRQDMMVLLSRAMSKAGKLDARGMASDLDAFTDKSNVASYAVNDIAALIQGGIVEGNGSMLNPTGNATRAEAAVLLYRIYNTVL
ncbi:S-layer homology domain-containing protein [Paenibacillus rigui]|uniref:S-layer homology domain-containing protein n=1 Tax=Paenibacillus rigui TaxID=554312 RepID=UPI0015C63ED0|nr:S-layer homology domain-containing protein [Paenibacillus rigui]